MSEPTGPQITDHEGPVDTDDPAATETTSDVPPGGDGDDHHGDGAAPPTGPARQRPMSWWVGWILAVIGLVTAAVLAALLFGAEGADDDRASAEEAAGRFALILTNWDASDGMADTREELREASSESFAAEVDELFGGTGDLAELEEIGARSTAEVDDVLVQRLDGDRAEVLAVVVQRLTTDITEGEERTLRYARLGLVREDGAWRVDRVELLVDLLQETAERIEGANVPGGSLGLDEVEEGDPVEDPADADGDEADGDVDDAEDDA